jgi:hypothetical protein
MFKPGTEGYARCVKEQYAETDPSYRLVGGKPGDRLFVTVLHADGTDEVKDIVVPPDSIVNEEFLGGRLGGTESASGIVAQKV